MKSIRKPLIAGVMITSLLLTNLTGCGASSASGNATESSQDSSSDSSASSENIFAFTEDSDMELTSTTIVGRVTGISDNTISLDIADLSDIQFGGPGQRPENSDGAPEDGQMPEDGTAPEKPEDGQMPADGTAPEKPDEGKMSQDDQAPGDAGNGNLTRPGGGKNFSFDLDSLTYVPGTLTVEDESMLLTATQRTLMSLFKGGDRQKGNMGEASSMPDLGSAESSTSDSSETDTDSSATPDKDSGTDPDDSQNPPENMMPEEETEEPVSLSDISEGAIVLITFDENGTITAIHVITDTDFLTQEMPQSPDQSDPQ